MNKRVKVTDEMLAEAVRVSFSGAGVSRALGKNGTGGITSHYMRRVKHLGLDISHFTGQCWNKGKVMPKKKTAEEILIRRETDGQPSRTKAFELRRALIDIGRPYCCDKCGQLPEWLGNPMTLDVDHINEDWMDDRAENLRFLCPNCHSQFSRNLIGVTAEDAQARVSRRITTKTRTPKPKVVVELKPCLHCKAPVKDAKNDFCCYECSSKSQEQNDWENIDLIKKIEVEKLSYVALGKIYSVSDNTVKKHYLRQKKDLTNVNSSGIV